MFRLLVLGMFLGLVYRTIKNALKEVLGRSRPPHTSPKPREKQPSWDVDPSKIKDAEFRDLDQ